MANTRRICHVLFCPPLAVDPVEDGGAPHISHSLEREILLEGRDRGDETCRRLRNVPTVQPTEHSTSRTLFHAVLLLK